MANVKAFIRDDYIKKNGTCAVYCQIYIGREKVRIPVGINVLPEHWDAHGGKVKGASQLAKDYNLIIQNEKAKISDVFVRFRLDGRNLTAKTFIKAYGDKNIYASFWDFMESELKQRKGLIASNTFRGQASTLKKFKEAMPELPFANFNEDTIRNIRKVLAKRFSNNPNTVAKNLITLKTYVRIAVRKKLIESNPFDIEKIKRVRPTQVWLTESELKKLTEAYHGKLFPDNLNTVLQYFLFACFTGMRLSDVKEFRMEQVKGEFIILNPIKTRRTSNEVITIPVTKPIAGILNDAARYRMIGKVFETYADAVTNRMLKKIADYVGIAKSISFHSARHTFASIFLERTDDLASLQKLLGHSDIKQTMVYVHLTEKKKVEQMRKCWDTLLL